MNYTSVEQSKKLVELGLDKDSADMIYIWHCSSDNPEWRFDDDMAPMNLAKKKISELDHAPEHTLPAWSVGQLISMLPDNFTENGVNLRMVYDLNIYKDQIAYNGYDFIHDTNECIFHTKPGKLIDVLVETVCWLIESKHFNEKN